MKKAKILLRFVAWLCFIGGLALLFISLLMDYRRELFVSHQEWFNTDIAFIIGAVVGLFGLIMVAIIEDKANWESICNWIENRKKKK